MHACLIFRFILHLLVWDKLLVLCLPSQYQTKTKFKFFMAEICFDSHLKLSNTIDFKGLEPYDCYRVDVSRLQVNN